ncbi:MAG: hypothetical protein MRY57_02230 [Candidatus Pacebacteria bacterium]|nr:hypothetical protein [Candidatus Paceibacterota bacterium]
MPGEHCFYTTLVPIYFNSDGKYSSHAKDGIDFTIPRDTKIEIWNHGNKTKIRWSSSNKKTVRKIINMRLHDAKHLFKNKSA